MYGMHHQLKTYNKHDKITVNVKSWSNRIGSHMNSGKIWKKNTREQIL